MAEQTAQRVLQTGEDQFLYNLSAAERRIVHMSLSEFEGVETESFGEGSERYLVVKLKK